MKHETQTTETFTQVSYTCDVCGNALLDGQKPRLCGICWRETCGKETCTQIGKLADDGNPVVHICHPCVAVEAGGRARIEGTMRVARTHCEEIRTVWKQRSLAQKENT